LYKLQISIHFSNLPLESDIGVVIVEEDKLEEARQIIAELKGEPG
jgi:hypothetical protein